MVVNYASGAARADEVVAEIKAAGGEAVALGGSVAKARREAQGSRRTAQPWAAPEAAAQREEVAKLFADTMALYGKLDVLVNK